MFGLMCVPMMDGDEVLGAIYADSRQVSKQELDESGGMMSLLATNATIALKSARAHREQVMRDLLARDPVGDPISVGAHCYGCTAGSGSSCSGALA